MHIFYYLDCGWLSGNSKFGNAKIQKCADMTKFFFFDYRARLDNRGKLD